jgi:WD40 repeat protein
VKVLQGTKQKITALAFSPDGLLLAAGGSAGRVELWDLAGGVAARSARKFAGLAGTGFTPDSRTLVVWATEGDGEVVKLTAPDWATTGRHLFSPYAPLRAADLSPDGAVLVAVSGNSLYGNSLAAYSTDEFEVCWRWPLALRETTTPMFSPDGRRIAMEQRPTPRRDKKNRCISLLPVTAGIAELRLQVPEDSHDLAAWSPDSRLLVTVGRRLIVWDIPTHEPVMEHEAEPRQPFTAARFHPTAPYLLATTGNGTVGVWSMEAWREVQRYAWDCGNVSTLAVAADGMRAAVGGAGGRIVVWDWDL